MNPNLLSSKPAVVPPQFRRCACGATLICEPSPSTALPCQKCGGEMLVSQPTTLDILAERAARAGALERLAAQCEANADTNGNVSAKGAATHMRSLADWMRRG